MMPAWMLIFCGVAATFPHLPSLPNVTTAWLGAVVAVVCWRVSPTAMAALLAMAWVSLHGHHYLSSRLPVELEGQPLQVEACVAKLFAPFDGRYRRVTMDIVSTEGDRWGGRVQLGDYAGWPLHAGHCYAIEVKLKRPHSLHNFALPDRGAQSVARGIVAQGYIRQWHGELKGRWYDATLRQRSKLQRWILDSPLSDTHKGLLAALVLGDKSLLDSALWQDSVRSGTVHLLVVSGLHVGMAALSTYGLCFGLAWCWPNSYRWLSRRRQAWLGAWFGGVAFALLSGWGLPAQRAVIMLSVAVWYGLQRRPLSPWLAWGVACMAVLVLQPMAGLSLGFWLSFGLVAALMAGASNTQGSAAWGRQLLLAQGRCLLFSTPLLWWQTGAVSAIAPFVNLLLVPAMSVLLPALLLLSAGAALSPWFWWPLQQCLQALYWVMHHAAEVDWAFRSFPMLSSCAVTLVFVGVAVLLLPPALPWRTLAWPVILLAGFLPVPRSDATLRLDVFDVGQGSAVLLQSAAQVGLYDTGPRYGDYTAMQSQLLPVLRRLGIEQIDQVWVSHSDSDHSGGWRTLRKALPVLGAALPHAHRCERGQRWRLGDVVITALWPLPDERSREPNNLSCTLLLEVAGRRLLLPGDIEAGVEARLMAQGLPTVDVLFAPHHGSKTSSSVEFVNALQPRHVVVESGYRNRYGHPHSDVMGRYHALAARDWWTARDGAIRIEVAEDGRLTMTTSRRERPAFWH